MHRNDPRLLDRQAKVIVALQRYQTVRRRRGEADDSEWEKCRMCGVYVTAGHDLCGPCSRVERGL